MISHYLSSNNEMCYNIKINNFSWTKQGLSLCGCPCMERASPFYSPRGDGLQRERERWGRAPPDTCWLTDRWVPSTYFDPWHGGHPVRILLTQYSPYRRERRDIRLPTGFPPGLRILRIRGMALCPVWCGTYPLAGSDKFWQSIQAMSSPESARAKSTSHSASVPEWRVVTSLTSRDHPGGQASPEVPPDFRETHIHGLRGPSCGGRARRIPSCKDRARRMSFPEGRPRRDLLFGGRHQVRLHPLMGSVPSPLLSPRAIGCFARP